METNSLFPDEPEETRIAILKATFEALAEHGYANLTIDRIGQHFPKSEGLVFYHYDGKDDVLLDLLDYLLERFEQIRMPVSEDEDPENRLRSLFEQVIFGMDEQQLKDYEKALTELRMRAAQDEEFQTRFDQSQDVFTNKVEDIIQDGVESGDFRDTNPKLAADFLTTLVSGFIFERVTAGVSRPIQSELDNYIQYRLLADDEYCDNREKSSSAY